MGVDTLELDIGVTRDEVIVVSHERGLNPDLARDAEGVYVAPPGIPFVQLTLAEVKTYDVGQIRPGSAYAAQFPDQHVVPGTRIPTLIEVISRVMTLEPGDLISTGTPAGVGPIVPGNVVEIEIEGIGILSNPVVEESE